MSSYVHDAQFRSFAYPRADAVGRKLCQRYSDPKNARPLEGLGASGRSDIGFLVYSTSNFGDEVQTLAQMRFLPPSHQLKAINRDHLNRAPLRRTTFFANGWHTHNPENWPPNDKYEPIFVSVHIAPSWVPSSDAVSYLKKHSPIGCRDTSSMDRLRELGVDAYFSGCMTLTLENRVAAEDRTDQIIICDAHLGYDGGYPPSAKTLLNKLVPSEVLHKARRIEQECPKLFSNNYAWKMRKANGYLEAYSKAKLVITTRLHCALPCRALGTPVLFLHQQYDTDPRFDGLRDVLLGYGPDTEEPTIDWDNPQPVNIDTYKQTILDAATRAAEKKLLDLGA